MAPLSRELRRILENSVAEARRIAEAGAKSALESLAVDKTDFHSTMSADERHLRLRLRAHGRQLGDTRDRQTGTQTIWHLTQSCAYEQWHRMLFARFLAENGLLLDPEHQLSLSMDDVRERARVLGQDWLEVASNFAQRMLLNVFRPGDPVLEVALPPEKRQQLEAKLEELPPAIFTANDSLGWVYQFWQKEEKDRVNNTESKIGADQLAPVTQLFTDDYMVLFLLHNTFGAWWVGRTGTPALGGYEWNYLRLKDDGSPAAGTFSHWPKYARDLRILDPCMGSGHFLVFALPIIVRMRMVEESLSLREAVYAVLRDNLFGLELDMRCSQIAAFNLALNAWRLAGDVFPLPTLRLACSGLGINAAEADWVRLAGGDSRAQTTMQKLYELFQRAPTLGSLIDPTRMRDLITAGFDDVLPLFERALAQESVDDERKEAEEKELVIAAEGLLAAARILVSQFTLVVTNVPYLGRGRQDPTLSEYCSNSHRDAKADLATCFVDRCLRLAAGSVAVVSPDNWLFLPSYKKMRERLLRNYEWNLVARLGPRAFEAITGEVVSVSLLEFSSRRLSDRHSLPGWDLGDCETPGRKASELQGGTFIHIEQSDQLLNPDARIVIGATSGQAKLSQYASSFLGLGTGDYSRYGRVFWEFPFRFPGWTFEQGSVEESRYWSGLENVVAWDHTQERVLGMTQEERAQIHNQDQSGQQAWGQRGVAVSLAQGLRCSLYSGEKFDKAVAVLIPKESNNLAALWAFCSSPDFNRLVRELDRKVIVANGTLTKIPFDLAHWQGVAKDKYPTGLPQSSSEDPTQWLFNGHPKGSQYPLQVAVARLLGYQWPRQTDSRFPECPELQPDGLNSHAVSDGIMCLPSVHGLEPAHTRLRALLASAYGLQWSAQLLSELVGDGENLESWLANHFFKQHCDIFHSRPFIWHIWDGRKDGFHALVSYHKLAGSGGESRRTLERLIYTYLGDWIRTQESQIGKVDGADARLVAAQHLRQQLELILKGEPPFDVFVRWKPIHEQGIGWEPDLNDGIRVNIRPWLKAKPYKTSRRDACILRETPITLPLGKDRGKEPLRDPEDFPWFSGATDRTNDIHLTKAEKQAARARKGRK